MRRTFVTILIALLALFAVVSVWKRSSGDAVSKDDDRISTFPEKEKIQQFWEVYRRATRFRIAGNTRKAVAEYRKAISLNNSHEDALYYLGNMYFDLGELEAAEQIWRRLAEVNPNSARAHSQLGTIYLMIENGNMFNLDAAEAEFQRAFAINKEVTAPVLRLGQIALIRGNFSESQRLFNAVIGSNTRSVEAHFLTGYIDWKRGNLQKALTSLTKAAEYSRPTAPVQRFSGEGDTKSGRPAGSTIDPKEGGLFETYFSNLSELTMAELPLEINSRYRQLDAFLEQISHKIEHQTNTGAITGGQR